MKPDEQVLVIPTSVFHAIGAFQGLCRDVERYQPLLDPARFLFLPRPRAEDDAGFKQLIPYVVLKHGDQVFHYRRGQGAGEKRLRALRSVGIGGHINPIDLDGRPHAPREEAATRSVTPTIYRQGMLREVEEEIAIDTTYQESCIGFINDDATPVGQVHLGIVHVFELAEPRVQRREADVTESGFAPITELMAAKDGFETWSQFVLQELAK
jgi:predicted NUDIX family phosphoesterase